MMLVKHLIGHHFKKASRSKKIGRGIFVKAIYWFFIALLIFYLLLLGSFMDVVFDKIYPDKDPFSTLNGFLIYYFGFDLLMRLFVQKMPVFDIVSYLHLPIKRKNIVHFMLSKSLTSLFNLLPLFVFIPFCLKVVIPDQGWGLTFIWFASILSLIVFNNFLAIYLLKKLLVNNKILIVLALILGGLGLLAYYDVVNFMLYSQLIFQYIVDHQFILVLLVILASFNYWLVFNLLIRNVYIEELVEQNEEEAFINFTPIFLNKYGVIGQLLMIEVKLIMRNKRPRQIFWISIAFLAYGFMINSNIGNTDYKILLTICLCLNGIFQYNFGQFLFSWNGQFLDKYLSSNFSSETFFESKFWFFAAGCFLFFVLCLPFGFFGWKILVFSLTAFLFNIGVSSFLIMYISMYNPKKIDLSKGQMFNYEGVSASQMILIVGLMALPVLIFELFRMVFGFEFALFVIGFMGLVGIMSKRYWLNLIAKKFNQRKYKIGNVFRNK